MATGEQALALVDGWVFDMDATLTVAKHDFAAIRRQLGLPEDKAILESIEALPAAEQAPLHQALADWEWDIARQTEAAVGAQALLAHLADKGCRLAILTRNRKDIAQHTLEAAGLAQFFEPDLVLGRDCAPPKPSPAGILAIQQRWPDKPARVAMVGDYLFDLQAGRAAGCLTIHVAPKPNPAWEAEIDVFVARLPELLERLQGDSASSRGKPA